MSCWDGTVAVPSSKLCYTFGFQYQGEKILDCSPDEGKTIELYRQQHPDGGLFDDA